MDFGRVLQVLGADRWRVAVWMAAAMIVSALGYVLVAPRFMATAAVVVDVSNVNPVLGVSSASNLMARTVVSTQVSVVRSEGVARLVASRLGLKADDRWQAAWRQAGHGEGEPDVSWLGQQLLKGLDVRPSNEDGSVIDIRFSSKDRRFAAAVANAFADVYLEESARLRAGSAQAQSAFFKERVATLRNELASAQARLSAYQRDNGIVSGEERDDVETLALNTLASQAMVSREASINATSRQGVAAAGGAVAPDIAADGNVQRLAAALQDAQQRAAELALRLGPNHPQMEAAHQAVAQARGLYEKEKERALNTLRASVDLNRQKEADIAKALQAQRQRVLALKAQRDAVAVLERDVENARLAYEQANVRLNQTSQEGSSTAPASSLLTRATAPVEPSRPGLGVVLAIALLAGGLLGTLWGMASELRRPRCRSVDDLVGLGLSEVIELPLVKQPLPSSARQRLALWRAA